MVSIFRTKKSAAREAPNVHDIEKDCMMRLISDVARLRSSLDNIFQETDKLQWQMDSLEADHGAHIASLRAQIGSLREETGKKPQLRRNAGLINFLGIQEPEFPPFTESPAQTLGNFDSSLSGFSSTSSLLYPVQNQQVYSPLIPQVPERDPKRASIAMVPSKAVKHVRALLAVPESKILSSVEAEWEYTALSTGSSGPNSLQISREGSPHHVALDTRNSSLKELPRLADSEEEGLSEIALETPKKARKNRESFNLDLLFAPLD